MKICPTCQMTVDADTECPVCQTTLTYEPSVDTDTERYKFNKYFVLNLLKRCWFSLACMIVVSLRAIFKLPELDGYFVGIIALCLISFVLSVFELKISKFITFKYSENYAQFIVVLAKIIIGLIAIVLSLFLWI